MPLSPVVLVLLQLCGLQLVALARPTCQLQGNLVLSVHNALRDLGGSFPDDCLPYNANISFPSSIFPNATASHPQCHRASWVVYESARRAEQVFQDYDLPVGEGGVSWDDEKVDGFEIALHRLVDEGRCASSPDVSGVLSSYFSNVEAAVQQQDGAVCGWTALRRDLLMVLKSALYKHHTCLISRDMTTRGHGRF